MKATSIWSVAPFSFTTPSHIRCQSDFVRKKVLLVAFRMEFWNVTFPVALVSTMKPCADETKGLDCPR